MSVYKLDGFLTSYWVCRKRHGPSLCNAVMSIWDLECSKCEANRSRKDLALHSNGSVHGIFYEGHKVVYDKACAVDSVLILLDADENAWKLAPDKRDRNALLTARTRAANKCYKIPTAPCSAWQVMAVSKDKADADSAHVEYAGHSEDLVLF